MFLKFTESKIQLFFKENKLNITKSKKVKISKEEANEFYKDEERWLKASIINIATSILCTKWNIGPSGGGFVQHFVDNNLMGALGNADSTTIKGLQFFSKLVYNTAKPSQL